MSDITDVLQNVPQWASFQIRKVVGCACAGNAGNVFPRDRLQRKPLVSDPNMHHGTCVTHVPWCMSGSLTGGRGENVPGIPGACASAILRIWQEAHGEAIDIINKWNNAIASNKAIWIVKKMPVLRYVRSSLNATWSYDLNIVSCIHTTFPLRGTCYKIKDSTPTIRNPNMSAPISKPDNEASFVFKICCQCY